MSVSWRTGINIAVIKYWGKRDARSMTPLAASLSFTVAHPDLATTTTICASETDVFVLNGVELKEGTAAHSKLLSVCKLVREAVAPLGEPPFCRVESTNSGPTAAGLASSASGFSALAAALCDFYGVKRLFEDDSAYDAFVAGVARMGSGSACRSCFGGAVLWKPSPSVHVDKVAVAGADRILSNTVESVFGADHWPELRMLFLVVSESKKAVGSTDGMQRTVETSSLLQQRLKGIPVRIERIVDAIGKRDFATFAEITMQDSNSMHACCLDTFPPLRYMNEVSFLVVSLVHALNAVMDRTVCGYTFDAGPNAVLFYEEPDTQLVQEALMSVFPTLNLAQPSDEFATKIRAKMGLTTPSTFTFSRAIEAKIGHGPTKQ